MRGGPILVAGSCTVVHAHLTEGLVDELRLVVFPVSIGHGLRVFPEGAKLSWALVDHQVLASGAMALTYHSR